MGFQKAGMPSSLPGKIVSCPSLMTSMSVTSAENPTCVGSYRPVPAWVIFDPAICTVSLLFLRYGLEALIGCIHLAHSSPGVRGAAPAPRMVRVRVIG
jgi:hypothetical protein